LNIKISILYALNILNYAEVFSALLTLEQRRLKQLLQRGLLNNEVVDGRASLGQGDADGLDILLNHFDRARNVVAKFLKLYGEQIYLLLAVCFDQGFEMV